MDYTTMNVTALRKLASGRKIAGSGKWGRAALLEALGRVDIVLEMPDLVLPDPLPPITVQYPVATPWVPEGKPYTMVGDVAWDVMVANVIAWVLIIAPFAACRAVRDAGRGFVAWCVTCFVPAFNVMMDALITGCHKAYTSLRKAEREGRLWSGAWQRAKNAGHVMVAGGVLVGLLCFMLVAMFFGQRA